MKTKKDLEARIQILEDTLQLVMKDLDFYARHHHWLNTISPNFARESMERIRQVLDIKDLKKYIDSLYDKGD
jgi:hypothetical protein